MGEQFYITLPSTSSSVYYPDNTSSNYITHLLQTVKLVGDWEVALTEFHFPQTLFNVTNGSNKIKTSGYSLNPEDYTPATGITTTTTKTAFVPPGYYRNDDDFLLAVNKQMLLSLNIGIIRLNPNTQDAYFQPKKSTASQTVRGDKPQEDKDGLESKATIKEAEVKSLTPHVSFSPVLARQLGFEPHTNVYLEPIAKMPISLSWGLPRHIFIYSDIVAPQIVGDTVAPLLRMVNTGQEKFKYGDEATIILHSPQYLPVAKRQFDTIEIDLRENSGLPVPFMFGTSAVVLHFRRKIDLKT